MESYKHDTYDPREYFAGALRVLGKKLLEVDTKKLGGATSLKIF